MRFPRSAGILLHVTSLPGRQGIGTLGSAAYQFVDFLAETGQSWWQMLPIGPTGYGDSPYQSHSSFAGNPLLVSWERLADEQYLPPHVELNLPVFPEDHVDFMLVNDWSDQLLREAYRHFRRRDSDTDAFARFCAEQAWWLDDYALFCALKHQQHGRAWTDWPVEWIRRDADTLQRLRGTWRDEIEREKFIQFQFEQQWRELKSYARHRGVGLVGDLPIFSAHDSAEVWARQELFQLDEHGLPTAVAGVPPDYFSATGQLWGNPLYRWEAHIAEGFHWWVQRLSRALECFDVIRIDHFRGFERYWQIPRDATDARSGCWVPGPGAALFRAAAHALGPLAVIAEDLGVITPEVEALRDELGFPGMRVLQFAFGADPKALDYQPHNYPAHCVVYTGTHDNNTAVGWFHGEAGSDSTRTAEQIRQEQAHARQYLGTDGHNINWDLIRAAWNSAANVAIAPLQDILGLGTEARMNLPGTATGNWRWRFVWDSLTPLATRCLRELTAESGRRPATRGPIASASQSKHPCASHTDENPWSINRAAQCR